MCRSSRKVIPIFDSVRHDVHSLSSSMYHLEYYYFNLHGDILCPSIGFEYCDGIVIVKEMGIEPVTTISERENPSAAEASPRLRPVCIACH